MAANTHMDKKFLHSWRPDSWRSRIAGQQPLYPDTETAERVLAEIRDRKSVV